MLGFFSSCCQGCSHRLDKRLRKSHSGLWEVCNIKKRQKNNINALLTLELYSKQNIFIYIFVIEWIIPSFPLPPTKKSISLPMEPMNVTLVKDLEMGGLSQIILVGSEYNHTYPCRWETLRNLTHRGEKGNEKTMQRLEWYNHKPKNASSYQKLEETRKDSPLELP